MKHLLLTTIAAVLLVGCGPPPKDIWEAAEEGNVEAVKQHLAAGADVNAKNILGWTPLHTAAFFGQKEAVELLIAKGADVNAKNDHDETPLDSAFINKETAALLRKHGGKHSTINTAAQTGDIEAIKEFLIAGSDVNTKDVLDKTPLDAAIHFKQIKTAGFLLEHGGKTGKELKGGEPVGDIEAIKKLVARKERDIHTWEAAMLGNIEVVKHHLDAGADVNAMGGLREWTLLHQAADVGNKEIVELLIAEGADVNAKVEGGLMEGNTPLDGFMLRANAGFNAAFKETADLLRKHGGKTGEELKAEGK